MFSTIGRVPIHFDTSYCKMDTETLRKRKTVKTVLLKFLHVKHVVTMARHMYVWSGTRKHMSGTCFKQSEGCKYIIRQVIGNMDTGILRKRKNSETVLLKFSHVKHAATVARHMFGWSGTRKHMSDTYSEQS